MSRYEYKALPAPSRPAKIKGVKRPDEKLAATVSDVMNRMAADGWEYLRADTLPLEEPRGLLSRARSSFQTLLVFRRLREEAPAMPREIAPAARPDIRMVQRLWGREKPESQAPSLPPAEQKPTLVASAPEGSTPRIVADRPTDPGQP
ncbi:MULTISPECIES: DUF4177 domain-containing protein [unclassified Haematobacter]|uniref:DUF4177 domain-containing protein n=1 Tax=unclassified Haematobacter TaxID=2640585 RepID=UPI0025C12870|nr:MULTISPECIES: DUF4177 domain-containing protein [unclassified Haematobacter]